MKLAGDHGRDSFKISFQILNVEQPNSRYNTFIIGFAKVKDTYYNLKLMFDEFKENIHEIDKSEWQGKKVKRFLRGDYSFHVNMYG